MAKREEGPLPTTHAPLPCVPLDAFPTEKEVDEAITAREALNAVPELQERLAKYSIRIARLRKALLHLLSLQGEECCISGSDETVEAVRLDVLCEIADDALRQDDSDAFLTAHLAHDLVSEETGVDTQEDIDMYLDSLAARMEDDLPEAPKISAKEMYVKSLSEIFVGTSLPNALFDEFEGFRNEVPDEEEEEKEEEKEENSSSKNSDVEEHPEVEEKEKEKEVEEK